MIKALNFLKGLFAPKSQDESEDVLNAQIERTYKVIAKNIESAETYFEADLCDQLIENRLLYSYPYNYKVKACLFALRIQLERKKRQIQQQQPRLA